VERDGTRRVKITEIGRCGLTTSVLTLRDVSKRSTENQEQLRIAIVIGSTRPDRIGAALGERAYEFANRRGDASFALVDVAGFNLPLLDEGAPVMLLDEHAPILADQAEGEERTLAAFAGAT
jgi:hypothetical protein